MKIIKENTYYLKGFGFHYLKVLTEDNEIVKGVSLYLFGSSVLTLAISDNPWTSQEGKPYNFKIVDKSVYIMNFSVSFN